MVERLRGVVHDVVPGDADLEAAIAPYRGTKDTLRPPLGGEIPHPLVGRVVAALVAARRR